MSNRKDFVQGLYVNAPKDRAPDFVIAEGSIQRQKMLDWLNGKNDEWVNFQVNRPKTPNPEKPRRLNVFVDDWEPTKSNLTQNNSAVSEDFDDDLPF